MAKITANLGPKGYLRSVKDILTQEFMVLLEANQNQGNVFKNADSIQYVVSMHGHEPEELATNLQTLIGTHFRRFFDEVDLTVTTVNPEEGRYGIRIVMSVFQDGVTTSWQSILEKSTDSSLKLMSSIIS